MAETVYLLCAIASVTSAVMLLRTYVRRRTRILLWSSLCFAGLAASNAVLFLDLVVWPATDLSLVRGALGAAATLILVVSLIWEPE